MTAEKAGAEKDRNKELSAGIKPEKKADLKDEKNRKKCLTIQIESVKIINVRWKKNRRKKIQILRFRNGILGISSLKTEQQKRTIKNIKPKSIQEELRNEKR